MLLASSYPGEALLLVTWDRSSQHKVIVARTEKALLSAFQEGRERNVVKAFKGNFVDLPILWVDTIRKKAWEDHIAFQAYLTLVEALMWLKAERSYPTGIRACGCRSVPVNARKVAFVQRYLDELYQVEINSCRKCLGTGLLFGETLLEEHFKKDTSWSDGLPVAQKGPRGPFWVVTCEGGHHCDGVVVKSSEEVDLKYLNSKNLVCAFEGESIPVPSPITKYVRNRAETAARREHDKKRADWDSQYEYLRTKSYPRLRGVVSDEEHTVACENAAKRFKCNH